MFVDDYANTVVVATNQQSCNSCQSAALSCEDIKCYWPKSSPGYYNIVDNGGTRQSIYCDMGEQELCGSRGGWTRLAYLNMSDDTQNCPTGFRLYNETNEVIELVVEMEQLLVVYQFSSHLMVSVILRYVVE